MMNYPCYYDDAAAAAPAWCYHDVDSGEVAAAAAGDTRSFADLITGYYSTDDLFELVPWEQAGRQAGGASAVSTTMPQPPVASCRRLSPEPEVMRSGGPPSEVEMAAWLCAIVRGDEELLAVNEQQVAPGQDAPEERTTSDTSTTDTRGGNKQKLPITTEGMDSTKPQAPGKLREALALGGFPRRSHHGQAHKLTEKRRRHKINEKFRTLQQLVPGCNDKSNQGTTLDKTIQYMKSLQQHVQAMSDGGGAAACPTTAAAVASAVAVPMPAAPAMVLATAPAMMVVPLPFGGMLQLPHYPAPAMPLMAMHGGGAGSSSSGGHGNKGRCSIRSLRQKH